MQMFKLSDNHNHRKCYFERKQVPTQSVMRNKMKPPLANVYFKSMRPKLKVLAGLEPPMKGGGVDWYQPPNDVLEGRAVLKPVKKERLAKMGFKGIDDLGERIVLAHQRSMEREKRKALRENDKNWKEAIEIACQKQWDCSSKEAANANTEKILQAFYEFQNVFTGSINTIEEVLYDAARKNIQKLRDDLYKSMKERFQVYVKHQATELYDSYAEKLKKEQARLKAEFIEKLEKSRVSTTHQLHDINLEKHIAVEKLRNLLQCQNLACQIYVALKEREECAKEMALSKHEHEKKIKVLKEEIAIKDFETKLEIEKERKRQEFIIIWKRKICHVVKKFQNFVEYCLHMLPDHADFFINMEKLMLLQLSEASENPSVESLFEPGPEFHTPVARPHAFHLFCDKGYKPDIDKNLCPKRCTSSASQMPVIVVNKRCIYAACDNFELFTDKIADYIHGRDGDDSEFDDDHDYQYDVPFKFTSSDQLAELKLESSLMQIIQQELPNIKEVPIECCVCKIPYCFCSPLHASKLDLPKRASLVKSTSVHSFDSGKKIQERSVELKHERQPKFESYMNYVLPRKCRCPKRAKKHLEEHMPPYMKLMSKYDAPVLCNYEPCSVSTLKYMVKKVQNKPLPPPPPEPEVITAIDASTQYDDQAFEYLCNCFSNEEINKLFEMFVKGRPKVDSRPQWDLVGGSVSPDYLAKSASSFATHRAYSLRNLLDDAPDLEEIFKQKGCNYD